MKKTLLFLFSCVILVSGCGNNPYVELEDAVRKDPVQGTGALPNSAQILAAKDGTLNCVFDGECEPALSLVSVATGKGINRCSGFLIAPDRLLTNDHCLQGNPDLEKNCGQYLFAHFNGGIHRSCSKIISRSKVSDVSQPDYAIIELDRPVTDRKPLRVSHRSLRDGEKVSIYRVQMTEDSKKGSFDGIQTRINCSTSYRTLLNVNVSTSKAPVMTFGDCPIMNGNSGSPMLNSAGEVAAINQGYLSVKNDVFSEQLKPYLLDGDYGMVALGLQTRCVPELVGDDASACERPKPIQAFYPKDFLRLYGSFSSSLLPQIYSRLNWLEYPAEKSDYKSFATVPKCITLKDSMTVNFSFTAILMTYRQGFTNRLQIEWRSLYRLGEKQTIFTKLKTVSEESDQKKKRPMVIDFISPETGKISLPVCI